MMDNKCKNCVFGISFQHGRETIVLCTNSPQKPGELVEVRPMSACKNHKPPALRLDPPEPPNDEIRYIPLTQGKFAIVDADDYEWLSQYKWCALKRNNCFYAGRSRRKDEPGNGSIILMHREILKVPEGMVVDHSNNNSLDNRKENIRPATRSQNACNTRLSKVGCTSKYRGVSWDKRKKKWAAVIRYERKEMFLGYFDDEVEAAKAYDKAARKYHKEFARLNFPEETD